MLMIDAVVVTRGDVDITPVIRSLTPKFKKVHVWDNSRQPDLKVFGRYTGAAFMADTKYVYVQDDDVIVEDAELIVDEFTQYEKVFLVNNMPEKGGYLYRKNYEGTGVSLMGFGAVFMRDLATVAFQRYICKYGMDELLLRECDRLFTAMVYNWPVDFPIQHLRHATSADRMYNEERHQVDLQEMFRRIEVLKTWQE